MAGPMIERRPLVAPERLPADVRCAVAEIAGAPGAWSPNGGRLAYPVSPGGSIRAELRVVRPDGGEHRVVAGQDPRATVFGGCWAGSGDYACSIAAGDGPDADIVLVDAATGEHRTLAVGALLSGLVLARRGPRGCGYLTLLALTRWPDLFAAGATLAGMSDLRTFFAGTEPWMAGASIPGYGDPVAESVQAHRQLQALGVL